MTQFTCLRICLHSTAQLELEADSYGYNSGMQEYTTCPADYIKKLPDDFDLKIGALVEPLAVAWHAVATSPYKGP